MNKEKAIEIITNALQSDESKYTEEVDKALSIIQKSCGYDTKEWWKKQKELDVVKEFFYNNYEGEFNIAKILYDAERKIAEGTSAEDFISEVLGEKDTYKRTIEPKYYKDFEQIYIGFSDIARLIVDTPNLGVHYLKMDGDGTYFAYLVERKWDEEVEIGSHYSLVLSTDCWLSVYDDHKLTYKGFASKFNVYRAGGYGIIIEKINGERG